MAQATERKAVITTEVAEDNSSITFHVKGAGELVLTLGQVAEGVRARAMVHGFIQRVSDKAAIPCDTQTGKPATPAQKLEAMRGMVDHFMSGSSEWNVKRAEGTRKPKDGLDPLVIAAIGEATGKDEAHVRATIATLAESRKVKPTAILAVLGATAKVQPIIERMRAEVATGAGLDGDELLEGMGE